MIMMSSNDYLGLTSHPEVKEAAIEAVRKFGTGCAGSRFLNGTLAMHEQMEARMAQFLGKEAAAVFPTGFVMPADPTTGCESCVGAYADCTAACRGGGYGVEGYCAHPGSTDPGQCCACVVLP